MSRTDVPPTPTQLARMRAFLSGEVPPPPIARLLGLRMVDVDEGPAAFELDVSGARQEAVPLRHFRCYTCEGAFHTHPVRRIRRRT